MYEKVILVMSQDILYRRLVFVTLESLPFDQSVLVENGTDPQRHHQLFHCQMTYLQRGLQCLGSGLADLVLQIEDHCWDFVLVELAMRKVIHCLGFELVSLSFE